MDKRADDGVAPLADIAGTALGALGLEDPSARLLEPIACALLSLAAPAPDLDHEPLVSTLVEDGGSPRVSVVTPCYNDARYLASAIRSVLAQTYRHWEMIIVDDGSTDDTRSVVESFDDPRIRYIFQQNRGLPAAWNAGAAAAEGTYIARLDSDDIALPHRLASQLAYLEARPELSAIGSCYLFIDGQGQIIPARSYSWQQFPDLNDIRTWLVDCPFMPSATMFRRSAWQELGGSHEDLLCADDWNFWMRLVLAGHRMAWHRDVVCHYLVRGSSLSKRAETMFRYSVEALRRILEDPAFPPEVGQVGTHGLALRYVDGAKRLYRAEQWDQGREALETAISLDPGLVAGDPPRVEDELLNAALEPLGTDPIGFLRASFRHLPKNAGTLRARRRHVFTRCHLELLVAAVQRGDLRQFARHLLPLLVAQPKWLLTGASWAYLRRAIGNRVRRMTRDTPN